MEITEGQQFIISQIIMFFSYGSLAATYCVKNRRFILILSFLSNFLNICAYFLLDEFTSSITCAISIIRDIIFIIDVRINGKSDKITKKDLWILAGVYALSIAGIIYTFDGEASLMYTFGVMLYTYSIWQKNTNVYKYLGPVCAIFVLIDCILIKSVLGFMLECVVLAFTILGIVQARKETSTLKTEIEQ